MEHRAQVFDAVENWLGIDLDTDQRAALKRFEQWLGEEALPAGGLGPAETDRLLDRHILDSLAFLAGFPRDVTTAIDVGGGVGLPSIPLAIVQPGVIFTLVERSLRRAELAARAARIVELSNYSVRVMDVHDLDPSYDLALFRASLSIPVAANALVTCVKPTGAGLLGVSRRRDRPTVPSAPEGITFALSREGDRVLESPFWLLTMRYS